MRQRHGLFSARKIHLPSCEGSRVRWFISGGGIARVEETAKHALNSAYGTTSKLKEKQ